MERNLDGFYFRIKRNDKFGNYCWSDMTKEERYQMLEHCDAEMLKNFCVELGETIKNIGDKLDLICE